MKTIKNILLLLIIAAAVVAYFVIDNKQTSIVELENKIKQSEITINHQAEIIDNANVLIQQGKDSIKSLNELKQQVEYVYIEKEKELELLEPEEQIARFDKNTGDHEPTKLTADSLVLTPLPRIKNANRAFLRNVYLDEIVGVKKAVIYQYELAVQQFEDKTAAQAVVIDEQSKIMEFLRQQNENLQADCRKKRIVAYLVAGGIVIIAILI